MDTKMFLFRRFTKLLPFALSNGHWAKRSLENCDIQQLKERMASEAKYFQLEMMSHRKSVIWIMVEMAD